MIDKIKFYFEEYSYYSIHSVLTLLGHVEPPDVLFSADPDEFLGPSALQVIKIFLGEFLKNYNSLLLSR